MYMCYCMLRSLQTHRAHVRMIPTCVVEALSSLYAEVPTNTQGSCENDPLHV